MALNQPCHRERISLSAPRHRLARCGHGNRAGGDCGPKGIHEIRWRRRNRIGRGEAADVSGTARHAWHAAGRSRAGKFQSGFHAADCARDSGTHPYPHHQHHRLQRNFSGPGPSHERREAGHGRRHQRNRRSRTRSLARTIHSRRKSMAWRKRTLPWCRRTAASAINSRRARPGRAGITRTRWPGRTCTAAPTRASSDFS